MKDFDIKCTERVERLAQLLTARSRQLVTAESCTGGWVAKCCTDITGSSAWFDRGFITYSNSAKEQMLDVSCDTLETHGAVSEAVVAEMVAGALQHSLADVGVAISGIAGPTGGSDDKPVGTVCFAWAFDRKVMTAHVCFDGDRDAVRQAAVVYALDGLIEYVNC